MKDALEGKGTSVLIKLISIGFTLLVFFGCNGYYDTQNIYIEDGLIFKQGESKPFTGRILDTLENNIIEYDVVEGLRNGEFCVSNLRGDFTIHGEIENNKNVGKWHYYYESGRLESKGNFKNDLPHGKWQWFYEDGILKSEGNYINGNQEGEWKFFNENGMLNSIIRFATGEITNKVVVNKLQII
jgi:antitoxin component YwqK of YwqJK toxin-antitoxin module